MKKLLALLLVFLCMISTACGPSDFFGTKFIEDPAAYGKFDSYVEVPAYFPDTIEGYQVNRYAYTVYSYMDVCSEIFLDLTLTQAQFDSLLVRVSAAAPLREQPADYAEGYTELVFADEYYHDPDEFWAKTNVGTATIDKILFDPVALRIIFVSLHAHATGVFELEHLTYFDHFHLTPEDYVARLSKISPQ